MSEMREECVRVDLSMCVKGEQNDEGDVVDMYLPRKCSATNAIIGAKDHASVQINVAKLDKDGRMTGEYNTYAFCGEIRGMSESDDALNRLTQLDGILHGVFHGC